MAGVDSGDSEITRNDSYGIRSGIDSWFGYVLVQTNIFLSNGVGIDLCWSSEENTNQAWTVHNNTFNKQCWIADLSLFLFE